MTRRRTIVVALPLVLVTMGASCTSKETPPRAAPPAPATSTSNVVAPELAMRLAHVSAKAPSGRLRHADVVRPAKAVRRTMEDLYEAAFLAPTIDRAVVLGHFAGRARARAGQDLERLTLGAARSAVEVVPTRAILKLSFLAARSGRPVAAFARSTFEATVVSAGTRAHVTQHGDYVLRKRDGAWRIVSYRVRGRVPTRAKMRGSEAAFAPGLPSNAPLFVLVIGSDARPGRSEVNARADSIHIVGINPRLGRVSILGIPRDSWVPIPGYGTNKINAALVQGGPELLVRTVEQLTGIRIDAYVLTGFVGFERLVDAVGGLDVKVPYPIDDAAAGARLDAGTQHLNRDEALAFSRARHDVPAGDFSRSLNQGRVMIAALAALRRQAARWPSSAIPAWVLAGSRFLRTDLSLGQIFELVMAAPAFEPRRVRNEVASGSGRTIGGLSVVVLGERARASFRDLKRDGMLGG